MSGASRDVVVVGSGASGLTAANVAAYHGMRVLVVEKLPTVGGTSALSGGQVWIPGNHLAKAAGVTDSLAAAREYIRSEAGAGFEPKRVDAFLQNAAGMIEFLERNTEARYTIDNLNSPDYDTSVPGSARGGRTLVPAFYDGRRAGSIRGLVGNRRWWMTLMGLQVSAMDKQKFLKALRAWKPTLYVTKRILRHAWEMLGYRRAMTLCDGNALIASLLKSATDRGVEVWTSAAATRLVKVDDRVRAVTVIHEGKEVRVEATRGVILASGGFSHDPELRRQFIAHVAQGSEHLPTAERGNTGDGMKMAVAAGARVTQFANGNNAAWAPAVRVPGRTGAEANVPLLSRGSPGMWAVMRDGSRFANESNPYHDFVQQWIREAGRRGVARLEAFLICDHRTIRKYGLAQGVIRPWPYSLRPHLKNGFLIRGASIEELANNCGIDAANLVASVKEMNEYAARGKDLQFGRGESPYNLTVGDAENKPNPCLGPIKDGPFYAVRMSPGHIGTFAGISNNENAQVIDRNGDPIPGLYAVGNDMASAFGGDYPGRGGTLGPGMTFAYIAGRHIASADDARDAAGDDREPLEGVASSPLAGVQ